MNVDERRLFFGAEVQATWPKELPEGRLLEEPERHITLAFLGQTSLSALQKILPSIPRPTLRFGPIGKCDQFLLLPKHHPRVASGHVQWLEGEEQLIKFHKDLSAWLKTHGYSIDEREFFPHVTIARSPFAAEKWQKISEVFPLFLSGFHLYESVGNLTYVPRWSHPLLPPFEEFEHTADIAFRIQGENLNQLHLHAEIALAFKFPPLFSYIPSEASTKNSLDDIVIALNDLIAKADAEIGTPFKAVSFHGDATPLKSGILQWEMIVDV
jgi:2'-5' RNA ligase